MKILLTGANGFLGGHLLAALQHHGHEVNCFLRNAAAIQRLKAQQIECVAGDFSNLPALQKAVQGVDAIIHCAGSVKARNEAEFIAVNAHGTKQLLLAAAQINPQLKRFILISSLAAQGPNADDKPISQYGRSKLLAEAYTKQFSTHFPVTIFRPPVIYGPGDMSILPLFKVLKTGLMPLPNRGQMRLGVIYVTDAVKGIIQGLHVPTPSGNTYYLDDGHIYRLADLFNGVAEVVTTRKPWIFTIPISLLRLSARVSEAIAALQGTTPALTRDKVLEMSQAQWLGDADPARRDLDWKPAITWTQGVTLTYNWYQKMDFL